MNDQLNPEEREILEKFERGELRRATGAQSEMEAARIAARSTFKKTRRVNLRVTERDFNLAHARAREEGIPYQTLLSSVIHKYLSGRLTEKRVGYALSDCRRVLVKHDWKPHQRSSHFQSACAGRVSTSISSISMKATRPSGPNASGISVAPAG